MEKKSLIEFQKYKEDRFTKLDVYKQNGYIDFVLNFLPGQELPSHNHPGMVLSLLVLEGSGILTTDGEETGITKSDLISVTGEEQLSIKNNSNNSLSLYVNLKKI